MKNFVTLLVLLLSLSVLSQKNKTSEVGGWPDRKEIIGFWKMVRSPNLEKMNKENPWPQAYQWFAFYDDGRAYAMMTDTDANYTPTELQQIFEALPKNTPTFEYNGKFMEIVHPDIPGYSEIWGINLFAKDIGSIIKKGDLIMSLDDGTGKGNNSIVYYRLLRKIE